MIDRLLDAARGKVDGADALWRREEQTAVSFESGRLKVLRGRCPHLLREAELYRYPSRNPLTAAVDGAGSASSENPIDAHNHALAALRYLITKLDAHRLARPPRPPDDASTPTNPPNPQRPWLRLDNEFLWQRLD